MAGEYGIVNVRMFLEPPEEVDRNIVFFGLGGVQIPESFIPAVEEALRRDPPGIGGGLTSFLDSKRAPLAPAYLPPVEHINRIDDWNERKAFFAGQARSLWDGFYSTFDVQGLHGLCVSLLVEYELHSFVTIEEDDRRCLFLDCKHRYISALGEYKSAHAGCLEAEAVNRTWEQVSHEMLLEYGVPADRMAEIIKEGTPRWNTSPQAPVGQLSFRHTPWIYPVSSPPPEKKYIARVVVR